MIEGKAGHGIMSLAKTGNEDEVSFDVECPQQCVEQIGLVFAVAELILQHARGGVRPE